MRASGGGVRFSEAAWRLLRLGLLGRILQSLSMSQLGGLERHEKGLQGDIDPAQRAAEERVAGERYAVLLSGFIKEAKLPVTEQLQGISDPDRFGRDFSGTAVVKLCGVVKSLGPILGCGCSAHRALCGLPS